MHQVGDLRGAGVLPRWALPARTRPAPAAACTPACSGAREGEPRGSLTGLADCFPADPTRVAVAARLRARLGSGLPAMALVGPF